MPEETETGKQIKGALGGIAEGLAAAFAPKKAPPKRKRPSIQVLGVLSDEDIQQAEQRNPGSTTKGKRPTIKMNPTKSGRTQKKQQAERDAAWQQSAATMPAGLPEEGGGSREEGAGTETGQNLANLMGSIVKESTTGKRYAEEGTHGQNWDLIRLGMDAQEQKSSMTQVDHAVESQYRHRKPQGEDELQHPAYGDTGWVAKRSKGSRGHFDAGHT